MTLPKGEVHEIDEFIAATRYFRDRLPVTPLFDLKNEETVELLFTGSCGAIGILKPWLNRALHRAIAAKRSFLTEDDLKQTMHSAGKLKRIAQAITAGRNLQACSTCQSMRCARSSGCRPPSRRHLVRRASSIPASVA